MAWTYSQSSGVLIGPDGHAFSGLYSGHGPGLNNPAEQATKDIGPIPVGTWSIGNPVHDDDTGPLSLPLTPIGTTNALGRDGFRVHGDSKAAPGQHLASKGCIVASELVRRILRDSPDRTLIVVAHL